LHSFTRNTLIEIGFFSIPPLAQSGSQIFVTAVPEPRADFRPQCDQPMCSMMKPASPQATTMVLGRNFEFPQWLGK